MRRIIDDISKGSYKPIYLLYGSEDYLIKQYKSKLVSAMLPEGDTMNLAVFDEKVTPEALIDMAETLPFFADRRVIVVIDSGFFKKSDDKLAEYFSQMPDTSHFIFVESEIDKRTKTFKEASKSGLAVEFTMLSESDLTKWIGQRLRQNDLRIEPAALRDFLDRTSTDMYTMSQEMDKLISFCTGKEMITLADINEICTPQIQGNVFHMIDAFASKNPRKAMDCYKELLEAKEPPLKILSLIERQFRMIEIAKDLSAKGESPMTMAAKLGCRDFAAKNYAAQGRNFTFEEISELLSAAADLETDVKTGRIDEHMSVEIMITTFCKQKP